MSATEVLRYSATAFDFNARDLVVLVVGEEQKEMIVHGTYLVRDSEFFAAAMKKDWPEGKLRRMELPEESPDTIGHYLTYVYGRRFLPTTEIGDVPRVKTTQVNKEPHFGLVFTLLARLYVCGERLLNWDVRRAVVAEMIRLALIKDEDGHTWGLSSEAVNIIYQGTPKGSPARRVVVDMHVKRAPAVGLDDDSHPAFVRDVANSFHRIITGEMTHEELMDSCLDSDDYL